MASSGGNIPPAHNNPTNPSDGSTPHAAMSSSSAAAAPVSGFVMPEPHETIEADSDSWDGSDADSALGSSIGSASDRTSLASSVLNYCYENGRRYHAYRAGEYIMPNDEQEQYRMDLAHHVFKLVLGGGLHRAPIENPQRVLDAGTGTGIWAIEFADEYPGATVAGSDLSPIQPSWVPPNCEFRVDDIESEWDATLPYDFIHLRAMAGSVRDWDQLMSQAFGSLRTGGWLEVQDFEVWVYPHDEAHDRAPFIQRWQENLIKASEIFGKPMNIVHQHRSRMEAAGFVDVTEDIYKIPFSPWAKDRRLKEIARYQQQAMLEAVEPYTLALFTRILKWTNEECQELIEGVRRELLDRSIRVYGKMHFVYGRKP